MKHPDGGPDIGDAMNRASQAVAFQEVEHGVDQRPMIEDNKNPFAPKLGMMSKGIATGVAVSAITQTGRNIVSTLIKHPLVLIGLGFATGFLAHKYRKEIIATASSAAEQGKDFVLRQKESLGDLLAESKEAGEESGASK